MGLILHGATKESAPADLGLCLIGRFVTERFIRTHIMKERLAEIWRPARGVSIKEASPGLFVYQFFHKLDMDRVVNGGLWTFDNHLLVLGRMQVGLELQNIPLNHADFWVQVHHLPVGFMTELVGKHLANFIGEFIDYDSTNNSGVWCNYIRLRVHIDIRQPLKKEHKVRVAGGEWCIVKFKYEKLPIFCFVCGRIRHTEQSCEVLFEMEVDDGVREWGVELRVDPRRNEDGGGNRWLRDDQAGRRNPSSGGSRIHFSNSKMGEADPSFIAHITELMYVIFTQQRQALKARLSVRHVAPMHT